MSTLSTDHAPPHPEEGQKPPSNLTLRVVTGLIGAPIVLALAVAGGWLFVGLAAVLVVVALLEFCALGRGRGLQGIAVIAIPTGIAIVVALYMRDGVMALEVFGVGTLAAFLLASARGLHDLRRNLLRTAITAAGLLYIAFPAGLIVMIRHLPDGIMWLLLVLTMTWGTDSFAFIGGKLWGRTKLAPMISPKKTQEGAIVGIVGGVVPAMIVLMIGQQLSMTTVWLALLGPLVAILGDLVESGLKRVFHAKDSHLTGFDVLPGHGGVLDRVDSLILVTVFCYSYLVLIGVVR